MASVHSVTAGTWYRVPDPRNVAILDTSALQGWTRPQIEILSRRFRLAVPDCLFGEVLLKDRDRAQKLVRKLAGINCVVVDSLGAHRTWEVANKAPVGLLLNDQLYRGFPEHSAQRVIRSLCERTELEYTQFVEDFRDPIDRPDEEQWEEINSLVLKTYKDTEPVPSARKADRAEFLAGWRDTLRRTDFRELMRPRFQDRLNGFRTGSCRAPDAAAMMSEDWVTFRYFVGLLTYRLVNLVANPPSFTHKRLNQRLDLHYLALTGPGMHLVTHDAEMRDLAAAISPHSHVIWDPAEV